MLGIEPDNILLANFTRRYSSDIKENVMYTANGTTRKLAAGNAACG